MSNLSECIDLYLTDDQVTDAQFRALIEDAHARDLLEDREPLAAIARLAIICEKLDDVDEEQGRALVLLNRVDDVRSEQMEALDVRLRALAGFVDGHAGQLRVLRERLDAREGK